MFDIRWTNILDEGRVQLLCQGVKKAEATHVQREVINDFAFPLPFALLP
jgi:hypothetical protein